MVRLLFVLFVASLCGCQGASSSSTATPATADPTAAVGPSWFDDVTAKSGINFTYRNGEEANHYSIIESLGGGLAAFDYDRDGLTDLFLVGGGFYEGKSVRGHPCKLYRNLGDLKFQDVSAEVGLGAGPWQYSHAAAAFDYDNDGFTDLLISGYNRLILWHNEDNGKGGRTFKDATANSGLQADTLWSTSVGWGDFDGDGFADLYVAHYGDWGFDTNHPTDCTYDGKTRDVCQPRKFKPLPHDVYRNNGNGTFTRITDALKLRKDGKGLGVLVVDVNRDGKPDVYVANDTDDNFLYLNRSTKPGEFRFEEVGLLANVSRDDRGTPNGSMGIDAADFDHTQQSSIVVTNYESELPALYQNRSNDKLVSFGYATLATGIAQIGGLYVSWGTSFTDFDHDGWEDLTIANGHAIRFPAAKFGRQQRTLLLRNREGKFRPVMDQGGSYYQEKHNARGLVTADFDNDGKPDIAISHLNEPVALEHNINPDKNHWLGLELIGKNRRSIVGATVTVKADTMTHTRFVKGGGSFASTNDARLNVGLGIDAGPVTITVAWPHGLKQTFSGLRPDRYITLREGDANEVLDK